MLELNTATQKDILQVELEGALDSQTSADFKAWVEEKMLEGYRAFAFDCLGLQYISSRGISVLLELKKLLSTRQGDLVLYQVSAEVQKLLEFLQVTTKIQICENSEEAYRQLADINKAQPEPEPARTPSSVHLKTDAELESDAETEQKKREEENQKQNKQTEPAKPRQVEEADRAVSPESKAGPLAIDEEDDEEILIDEPGDETDDPVIEMKNTVKPASGAQAPAPETTRTTGPSSEQMKDSPVAQPANENTNEGTSTNKTENIQAKNQPVEPVPGPAEPVAAEPDEVISEYDEQQVRSLAQAKPETTAKPDMTSPAPPVKPQEQPAQNEPEAAVPPAAEKSPVEPQPAAQQQTPPLQEPVAGPPVTGQTTQAEKIIYCPNCGARVRVRKTGKYLCPSCRVTFRYLFG